MSKKKKIVKLAVLRENDNNPCPFGLPISFACKTAGDLVDKMAYTLIMGPNTTSRERYMIATANLHLLMYNNPQIRCKFAGKLIETNNDIVECNWDSIVAGSHQKGALRGSPFYPKFFSGIGIDGLFSYPLGYYSDDSQSRHRYYGLFGLEGSEDNEGLIKASDNHESNSHDLNKEKDFENDD